MTQEINIDLELNIASDAVVLADVSTGYIFLEKNADARVYPASTTKIMTALIAIDYAEGRDGGYEERVVFSDNAVFGIEPGSSNIAMDTGESLSLRQALFAMMVASANEVAMAIAEHIGGSVEGFADMMNERAASVGCGGTHFVNPHGLDDPEHYTTARDMAAIMREAVRRPFFRELVAAERFDVPPTEKQKETRRLINSNKMIQQGSEFFRSYIIGGKTGYTDLARHSLVSLAELDGGSEFAGSDSRGFRRESTANSPAVICAVMSGGKNQPYTDTAALCEYGFGEYAPRSVSPAGGFSTVWLLGENGSVRLTLEQADAVMAVLPKAMPDAAVEFDPILPESVAESPSVGDVAGIVELRVNGSVVGSSPLVVISSETATEEPSAASEPAAYSTDPSPSNVNSPEEPQGGVSPYAAAGIGMVVAAGAYAAFRLSAGAAKRRGRRKQ
ncbi:MAG: D-alanyl-D-alanine carboxypeptidase [Clostridiales bacterium]|nr:D-alanyl-D-alanine carboxypeptidase [Clostridiales bacterium]